jgi:hypothetical protein
MRRLVILAVLAASFAIFGNAAFACSGASHVEAQPATAEIVASEFYFEQAVPAARAHHAHHNHRAHDGSASCDGTCCGCAASAAVALPTSPEINYPLVQFASHRGPLADLSPRQLTDEFYGPPKPFA